MSTMAGSSSIDPSISSISDTDLEGRYYWARCGRKCGGCVNDDSILTASKDVSIMCPGDRGEWNIENCDGDI